MSTAPAIRSGRPNDRARRERLEAVLVIALSIACLALAIADLLLLATYSA